VEAGTPRGAFESPRGPVEEVLASVWAALLGARQVGRQDGFFTDLGGHSLLATQLVSRLRDLFRLELPLRVVFECPTVAALAAAMHAQAGDERLQRTAAILREIADCSEEDAVALVGDRGADRRASRRSRARSGPYDFSPTKQALLARRLEDVGGAARAEAIPGAPNQRRFPLSFSQQRIWFLTRLMPADLSFTIEAITPFGGPLDRSALRKALRHIVTRHDVLRTTVHEAVGVPFQVVGPPADPELPVLDLTGVPEGQREEEKERALASQRRRPMDLATGPLLAASLIRLGEERHLLYLRLHHIVADGWSVGILVRELEALYAAHVADRTPALPDLPVQYTAFAAWQRREAEVGRWKEDLDYWKACLADLPVVRLPTDRPRPKTQTFRGAHALAVLPRELEQGLDGLSREEECTLFMTLLAAFALLLRRSSGQDDLVIGTHLADRDRRELEPLIGLFLNTLVLRLDVGPARTFADLLRRARDVSLAAYTHRQVPFEVLVAELSPARDLGRNPLFQIAFQFNNAPGQVGAEGALASLDVNRGLSIFDLSLAMARSREGLICLFEYSTDLFEAATIGYLADDFRDLLQAVVADPHRPLAEYGSPVARPPGAAADGTADGGSAAPGSGRGATGAARDPELEGCVAAVWQGLLGRERVGPDDNFFELGGHSLLAVQLCARLRKELGVEIPLQAVFERPTVTEIAQLAAALLPRVPAAPPQPRLTRLSREQYRRGGPRPHGEGP
jgi:acyl carrier protein